MSWSHPGRFARRALAVNLLVLAACAPAPMPTPGAALHTRDLAGPFAEPPTLSSRLPPHPGYTDRRKAGRVGGGAPLALLPGPPAQTHHVLDDLTEAVEGATFDTSLGARLAEVLEEAEDAGRPVDTYGTGALSYTELFGDDIHVGACELPQLTTSVTHGGESWDITLGLALLENFVGDLTPARGTLPEACAASLLAAGGDVDAADDCSSIDALMFFPDDSECRACVEASAGDIAACQDEGRCEVEALVYEAYGGDIWHRLEGTILSCAPDWTVPAYVLAHLDPSGALPAPFDYKSWGYVCAPFWDPATAEVSSLCTGGYDTMRVGVGGLVEGMRRDGDDTPWYRHRGYYTPRITLEDGTELRYAWEAYVSTGVVSYPVEPPDTDGDGVVDANDDYYGYQYGSWGLNPLALRPGATDAEALDDTFARDWFGAIAVKTATAHDDVSILMANHTRCAADAWEDPDGDGVFRCTRTEDPAGGWLGDLPHFRWDPDAGFSYPMAVVTLGSTGLPDPEIPGGIVPFVASSPTLGDPEWDGCTWSNTFTPDQAWLPDTPLDYTAPGAVQADTWRFGGHAELDLRVILYTNHTRDYCPDEEAP